MRLRRPIAGIMRHMSPATVSYRSTLLTWTKQSFFVPQKDAQSRSKPPTWFLCMSRLWSHFNCCVVLDRERALASPHLRISWLCGGKRRAGLRTPLSNPIRSKLSVLRTIHVPSRLDSWRLKPTMLHEVMRQPFPFCSL